MSKPQAFDPISFGDTNVGVVRKLNEDAWIERPEIGLWAVADGMGGHEAGEVASRMIVNTLAAIPPPADARALLEDVRAGIARANAALREEADRRQAGTIGATVVALMIHGEHFACLWAGDSRLYRFREGKLAQLNRDHSQVQELVDAGIISAEEAEHHPLANVVTRAVGAHDTIELEKISDSLRDGDIFLVCTDGLSKMVGDAEITDIVANAALPELPAALIASAIAHGGKDNVTAVVVQVCAR